MGPPATGKGTQAKRLSMQAGFDHLATGDLLRNAIKNNTSIGIAAKPIMKSGGLVPDQLVLGLFQEWLGREAVGVRKGVVFDGFPRTIPQADALAEILKNRNGAIERALLLTCGDCAIIDRVSNRRSCPKCGAVYNLIANPPKEVDVCGQCGNTGLIRRPDDNPNVIKERLRKYREQTEPLIQYYKTRSLLTTFDGEASINTVAEAIFKALKISSGSHAGH